MKNNAKTLNIRLATSLVLLDILFTQLQLPLLMLHILLQFQLLSQWLSILMMDITPNQHPMDLLLPVDVFINVQQRLCQVSGERE
jgi:hypothetical protein